MLLSWKWGKDSFDAFRLRASMALSLSSPLTPRCSYHLWLIHAGFGRELRGLASFSGLEVSNAGDTGDTGDVSTSGTPMLHLEDFWCQMISSIAHCLSMASMRLWIPTSCSCAWPEWGGIPSENLGRFTAVPYSSGKGLRRTVFLLNKRYCSGQWFLNGSHCLATLIGEPFKILIFVWSMYGLSKVCHHHSWESIPSD